MADDRRKLQERRASFETRPPDQVQGALLRMTKNRIWQQHLTVILRSPRRGRLEGRAAAHRNLG
jgi:hypothetical protein